MADLKAAKGSTVGKRGGHLSLAARRLRDEHVAAGPETAALELSDTVERSNHVFDPWLRCDSPFMQTLGDNVGLSFYDLAGDRKRKPKQRDMENVARITEAVLTNLLFAVVSGHEPASVAVSLGASRRKLTRYDAPGFAFMPKVLEALAGGKLYGYPFALHKSSQRGTASSIIALPAFAAPLREFGPLEKRFPLRKFYQAPGAETVILTRTERDYVQNKRTRELIDYDEPEGAETPSTRYRDEMEAINAALAAAPMQMLPDDGPPVATGCRRLQRFFSLLPEDRDDTPRFDQGGRLFGGWWQSLAKGRRSSIRLQGEPVADLDFASMFLRLAYLDAGHQPPQGDLYQKVAGFSDPRWRDGVKTVTNALLFRSTPMIRLPRDPELAETLPDGTTGKAIRAAILKAHPVLANTFETGAGFRLMFTESQILVAALLRLIDAGVAALPMHDGLMVPTSKVADARRMMEEAALQVTDFSLPITQKCNGNLAPA